MDTNTRHKITRRLCWNALWLIPMPAAIGAIWTAIAQYPTPAVIGFSLVFLATPFAMFISVVFSQEIDQAMAAKYNRVSE